MPATINQKLCMSPTGRMPVIHVGQYDSDFSIVFSLYSVGNSTWTMESGTTAKIRGTKTDGTGYSADCTVDITNKKVTVAGDQQLTAASGNCVYEIVLYKTTNNVTKELSSVNFILKVERAAMDAGTIPSETKIQEIQEIGTKADEIIEAYENLQFDDIPTANSTHAVKSGGVKSYIDEATVLDAALLRYGRGADAGATGRTIDEITIPTSNLFNPRAIVIGMNATGATGYPKRALSGAMCVGSSNAKIRVVSNTTGLKFEINRYSGSSVGTRIGYDTTNGWVSSPGVYTYAYNNSYIRFLFAKTDNSDITAEDLSGIKIQVNPGLVSFEWEPYRTANDVYARNGVNNLIRAVSIYGLLPYTGYTNKVYNSSQSAFTYSSTRLTSDYIEVMPGMILTAEKLQDTTEYVISVTCFDENKAYVRSSNYEQLYTDGYKLGLLTKYITFTIMHDPGTGPVDIAPSESENVLTKVYFKAENLQPTNLKVMTFNVGKWNYGVDPSGIQDSIYEEKLINYRRFFGDEACDVVGLQEAERVINATQNHDVRNVLFNHWYINSEITGNWESIYSRYPIAYGGNGQISNNRYYVYTYMMFENKIIYLLNVHLSPGHDTTAKNKRAAEAQEVLNLVSDKDYFVIFGDFNPEPDEYATLFKVFSDAGYNLANNGFFGDFWTCTSNSANFDPDTETYTGVLYVIDNIITSPNIKINSARKINTYSSLTSDHIPIVAELSVT